MAEEFERGIKIELKNVFRMAFNLHVMSGINSDLKSTRDYWRSKHPETEPIWKEK